MSPQCFCFLLKLKKVVRNTSFSFVIDRENKTVHLLEPFTSKLFQEKNIQFDADRVDIYTEALLDWDYIKAIDLENGIYRLREKGVHPIWHGFWKYLAPAILGGISGFIASNI